MRFSLFARFKDRLSDLNPSKVKYGLFTAALFLLLCFTVLNQFFLSSLEKQALEINDKEARLYAVAIAEQLSRDEINVIFNEIVSKSQVPMIITDNQGIPINWNNVSQTFWKKEKGLIQQVPFFYLGPREKDFLQDLVREFDERNQPLPLEVEGHTFGLLHYGEIPLVHILAWMPLVELFVILLFLIVGYLGFVIIRGHESSLLWIGLAKETAHQLGTPISSLLGWIEFLKAKLGEDELSEKAQKQLKILGEMESDISRLNKVATRFSQIGSLPELKRQSLSAIIEATAEYFKTRLPQLGKKIRIELDLKELPEISVNRELMGWVFENLVRNAADSIEVKNGLILIASRPLPGEGQVEVTVTDNGKGIAREHLKQIFNPGFTTKKRGWGLGLSLCRRIVKDYHGGKIYVEKSQKDVGTTFRILLPLAPPDKGTRKDKGVRIKA